MEFLINSEGATTKQNIDFEAVLKFFAKKSIYTKFRQSGGPNSRFVLEANIKSLCHMWVKAR